jgi:quaternary ammonium compound-resistance protein SugE
MAWIFLLIAGLFEIVWAYSMKLSDGFTRPVASAVTIAAMIVSFALLSLAMRTLPLGTAYAIWTGIGALGAFVVGIVLLGEHATPMRVASAALILTGMIGLKLSGGAPPEA